jgi:hypothetical protein
MRSNKIQFILLLFSTFFLVSGIAHGGAAESPTTYIDDHDRFILNGEPFFPLGLFVAQCSTVDQSAQLNEIRNSPFDTLMNYAVNTCGSTNATAAQITNYLNQLQARNLKLIFSLVSVKGLMDIGTATHKVNTFKGHPAIISWYGNDERSLEHLPELEAVYGKIRELDKNHPVWSVHWNTNWLVKEAHTTDIVGVDPYPIDNNSITLVSRMADAANRAGKPLWLVPQIFDWRDYSGDFRAPTGRPPTRDEMRAMTYLAINHGAKGLIYYSYFNIFDDKDYKDRWQQIKEIVGEIDSLRPVILSTREANKNDIVCNNRNIDFKLMRQGNIYYLLTVNTKKNNITGVSFKIKLEEKPAVIDTLFESGRQISVINDKATDSFGPYEVHVYKWEYDRS